MTARLPRSSGTDRNAMPVRHRRASIRSWLAVLALAIAAAVGARAAEITLMTSGALAAALKELLPAFERASGTELIVVSGGSVGGAPDSIPNRLERGERADVLIMAASSIDDMIRAGRVVAGSRVDLVRSQVGVAVRAGAPKPDISTVDALRRALLRAKSIAYSGSVSGVYVSSELFQKLGIAKEALAKGKQIDGEPVAAVVARGEAEIGFQQISELRPVAGVEVVGPLPADVQRVTVFSAAVITGSNDPAGARALIQFLASRDAAAVFAKSGLEPIAR
jgi:molybdate transport system substrate-binding protein